jgi:hypothetical protein
VSPVICSDCGKPASLTTGAEIYPTRPQLHHKMIWVCVCGARVGCHDGTEQPLGSPAGQETRAARMSAHAAFDPMWKAKMRRDGCSKKEARRMAYNWLARQMDIAGKDCHIGMMDADGARLVVEICRRATGAKA